eukprot:SAG11_NODE_2239_length_3648_cov_4.089039_5_plen_116_part_01
MSQTTRGGAPAGERVGADEPERRRPHRLPQRVTCCRRRCSRRRAARHAGSRGRLQGQLAAHLHRQLLPPLLVRIALLPLRRFRRDARVRCGVAVGPAADLSASRAVSGRPSPPASG